MQEFEPERPSRFDQEKIVQVLEQLIDRCRDGEEAYADAASHIQDADLRRRFTETSRERSRFAAELEAELERQGRWQTTRKGSASGMVERTAYDLKRALGGGDLAVLQSLESLEDHCRDAYDKALAENLPPDVLGLIRTQAQAIYGAHHYVKMLRDRKKAA